MWIRLQVCLRLRLGVIQTVFRYICVCVCVSPKRNVWLKRPVYSIVRGGLQVTPLDVVKTLTRAGVRATSLLGAYDRMVETRLPGVMLWGWDRWNSPCNVLRRSAKATRCGGGEGDPCPFHQCVKMCVSMSVCNVLSVFVYRPLVVTLPDSRPLSSSCSATSASRLRLDLHSVFFLLLYDLPTAASPERSRRTGWRGGFALLLRTSGRPVPRTTSSRGDWTAPSWTLTSASWRSSPSLYGCLYGCPRPVSPTSGEGRDND